MIFLQKTSVYPSFKRGLDGGYVRTSVPDDLTTAAAEVTHSCHHASGGAGWVLSVVKHHKLLIHE